MEFIAGIDGGGTKTRLIVRSLDGSFEKIYEYGAFNFNSIGEKAFSSLLAEICDELSSLGVCKSLCVGAAGISNSKMRDAIDKGFSVSFIKKWSLVGDNVTAHYGALSGNEGIILIAGTGAICYGRNNTGEEWRCGGWGHLIGDDGSGYALGRDALSHLAKVIDGYGDETIIRELVASKLSLKDRGDIIAYVYGHDKSAVAALSPLVEDAYWANDKTAVRIVVENATALVDGICCVADKLDLSNVSVALLGGLLSHETCMRKEVVRLLGERRSDIKCVYPADDALHGALMIAASMINEDK